MATQNNMVGTPEDAAQTERMAKIRFKQQVLQTTGGAMLFALIGVVTSKLLTLGAAAGSGGAAAGGAAAAGSGAAVAGGGAAAAGGTVLGISTGLLLSGLGIAAVAAIGLACVFLATKYLSKVVTLEHEDQARKICASNAKGVAPVIEPVVTPTPASPIPGMGATAAHADKHAEHDATEHHDHAHVAAEHAHKAAHLAQPHHEALPQIDASTIANLDRVEHKGAVRAV